jgi:hypothetical protein
VTNLIPVLVVSTSLGGICGLTITPIANIAVATPAAPAPIAGPVASAARMIET